MINKWNNTVSNDLFVLIEKWLEYYVCQFVRSAWCPSEGERFLFVKTYNKKGTALYTMEVLRGVDSSRSTKPKEPTKLDSFTHVFRSLATKEQDSIVYYFDPLDEFLEKERRLYFFRLYEFEDNGRFEDFLEKSLLKLQSESQKRGLLSGMEGEIRGWRNIARRLKRSIPTVMKLAESQGLPVAKIGGEIVTTERKISQWEEEQFKRFQCNLNMDDMTVPVNQVQGGNLN